MKIKTLLYTSTLTLFLTSKVFAAVSVATPSNTLSQVANSMNFSSSTNNNIAISQTASQTSTIIDAEELKEDVANAAEAAGLEVDTAALEVLSSSASNDNSVFAQIADNIDSEKYDWDKMPTFDADTIVFKDSSWNDLVKVNGVSSVTGLSYTSNNNFFDGTAGSQQGRGASFVNVAKGEISAIFYLRVKRNTTLVDGSDWALGGTTVEGAHFTGVAGLKAFPTSGTATTGFIADGRDWGTGFDDDHQSMKASATTLQKTWREGQVGGNTRENIMDWYNNHTNGNWDNRVFVTGKAIIPDGKKLQGTFSLESASCADSCTEKEYVESIERWEYTGEYVAEKWDGQNYLITD